MAGGREDAMDGAGRGASVMGAATEQGRKGNGLTGDDGRFKPFASPRAVQCYEPVTAAVTAC